MVAYHRACDCITVTVLTPYRLESAVTPTVASSVLLALPLNVICMLNVSNLC